MTKYKNDHGILSFSINGKDYISKKGDTVILPEDHPHIKALEQKKYIVKLKTKQDE